MPAIESDTLLAESKCYGCHGPFSDTQLLKLALLRRWLLVVNPGADVSPQALYGYGKCFNCNSSASAFDMLELALLDQIVQAA